MARLHSNVIVYDFETDSKDAKTCQPIQVAAVIINPYKMDYYRMPDGNPIYFNSLMRPNLDTFDEGSTKIHHKTKEMLAEAPLPQQVWEDFTTFVRQWNKGGKTDDWSAPVSAGYNNDKYDMTIVQRLCEQYKPVRENGRQALFSDFHSIDLMKIVQYWFWWTPKPHSISMDNLRKFFGMSQESRDNAHDALRDVIDTGDIIIKFMRLAETTGKKTKFVDCFTNKPKLIGDTDD